MSEYNQVMGNCCRCCRHEPLHLTYEMGFHHVAQTGLELLGSSHQLASASQSASITGVSHQAGPKFFNVLPIAVGLFVNCSITWPILTNMQDN